MYELTRKHKNNAELLNWTEEHEQVFNTLKDILINALVLAYPRPKDTFILDADASHVAIGAELSQIQDGVEKVISYGSASLTPVQQKYCTTGKELLAVVKFTQQYKYYLLG